MDSRLISQYMRQPQRVRKMVTRFSSEPDYRTAVQNGFCDRGHGLDIDRGNILMWSLLILRLVAILIEITKEFDNAKDVHVGSGGDVH